MIPSDTKTVYEVFQTSAATYATRPLLNVLPATARVYDIAAGEIDFIEQSGNVKKTLMIRSPFDGFVIQRQVEEGGYVKAGTMLFRIADLSRIWVEAHIYE